MSDAAQVVEDVIKCYVGLFTCLRKQNSCWKYSSRGVDLMALIVLLPQWESLGQPGRPSVSLQWKRWGRAQSCSAPRVAEERKSTFSLFTLTSRRPREMVCTGFGFWQIWVKNTQRAGETEREGCVLTLHKNKAQWERLMWMGKCLIDSLCKKTSSMSVAFFLLLIFGLVFI